MCGLIGIKEDHENLPEKKKIMTIQNNLDET